MQAVETPQADRRVPMSPYALEVPYQVIARGVEVTGIGAEADAFPNPGPDRLAQGGQLFESAAQCRPGPCGGLQQHADPRHRLETAGVGRGVTLEAGRAIVDEVARMGDDIGDAERHA